MRKQKKTEIIPNPNHYYIASFPRSGNTWVRFLLANVLYGGTDLITFQKLGEIIPDRHREIGRKFISEPNSLFNSLPVQSVKIHERYSPNFHNIIYVVRDGRDTLTSYYYWLNARRKEHISLSDIIRGKADRGLWSKHILEWVKGDCHKKMTIRYEDLLDNTEKELRRIVSFIDFNIELPELCRAVRLSSFKRLQEIEKEYGVFSGHIEAIKKTPFIRKGMRGDWKKLFTKSDLALFWRYHREGMAAMHYGES